MSLYKQKPDGPWWINVSHAGERVRESTGTHDRKEAQRFHDELKAKLWAAPKIKGRTWGQAVLKWVEKETRSDSELLSLQKFARLYPDRIITDVTTESLVDALAFCKTVGTFNRYASMINAVLRVAVAEKWLIEVPSVRKKTDKKKKPRQWITAQQWQVLVGELPEHQKQTATFAVESGLRQANVLGLRWEQVDLKRKLVWIEANEMKGGNALSVPLSDGALTILRKQMGQHDRYVFTFHGRPITEIKTGFLAACVRSGLGQFDAEGSYTGFTWHGLRHTWATWHVQNGTPLEVLMKLGGWSDLRMVSHYAHHSPGFLASFANNNTKTKP